MPESTRHICIVGAGIAGSALAHYLGQNSGYSISLVEPAWDEPDEIIGELLQPDGVNQLTEMGLDSVFEEINGQRVSGYAVYLGKRHYGLSYPENRNQEIHGYGFRYGKFVGALRKAALSHPSVRKIQGRAISLSYDQQKTVTGIVYQEPEGGSVELQADLTVLCQGSLSNLKGDFHREKARDQGFMVGILLQNAELPYASSGHVIMADPSPVLAYPVGPEKVRVLVDFPKNSGVRKKEELIQHLRSVTCPQMPEQLQEPFLKALDLGKIKARPTHQKPSRPVLTRGMALLGDSLNIRHPLTGAGMTVALTDVRTLGNELVQLNGASPETMQTAVRQFYLKRQSGNATMNILALALYQVFQHPELRKACFSYLKSGGHKAEGPMSLLSGISRNRGLLLRHFFAVGLKAVGDGLKPVPTPKKLQQSAQLLNTTIKIIFPLMMDELPKIHRS